MGAKSGGMVQAVILVCVVLLTGYLVGAASVARVQAWLETMPL